MSALSGITVLELSRVLAGPWCGMLLADLRAPAARPLLEALLREADVLVENYRTGGAESLGVGYAAVADLATGQNAATAILAALLQRQRSGRGQHSDEIARACGFPPAALRAAGAIR